MRGTGTPEHSGHRDGEFDQLGDKFEYHDHYHYPPDQPPLIESPSGPPLLLPPRADHFINRKTEINQLLDDLQPGVIVSINVITSLSEKTGFLPGFPLRYFML